MEFKTKVQVEDGKQEVRIMREFDLPLELLFTAYVEPEIVEQWMGSTVVKMESVNGGSYQLEKKDEKGNLLFSANGVIHALVPERKIIRTFEMPNAPFGVQLEIYSFERLTDSTSRLEMHVLFESVAQRDGVVQQGFAPGINWAHNRLEEVVSKLKK
jgi:uncharacterized protein YndB with AHSA1/START domain